MESTKTDAVGEMKPVTTTDAAKAAEAQGLEEAESAIISDIDIIDPEPILLKIAEKEYKVFPTPISKIKRIAELSKFEAGILTEEESAEKVIEIVCDLLGCPGDEHIKNHINRYDIERIFRAILKINTRGAKPKKKAD